MSVNQYPSGEEACTNCGGLILLGERIESSRSLGHLGPCCASFSPGVCTVQGCNLIHAGACF